MKIFVNLITTIRFAYTLILPIIKTKISDLAFIVNIIVLFLTDSIDGILARKYKVQTVYGSIMDTIADKTLCVVLMLLLIQKIDLIVAMLIGEIMIACINIFAMVKGKKAESSIMGKTKMWFISIAIILSYTYCFNIIGYNLVFVSICATILVQILTIIDYVKTLKSQEANKRKMNVIKNVKDLKYVLFNTEYYLSGL